MLFEKKREGAYAKVSSKKVSILGFAIEPLSPPEVSIGRTETLSVVLPWGGIGRV